MCLVACSPKTTIDEQHDENSPLVDLIYHTIQLQDSAIQKVIDSADVHGSVLIYDVNQNIYYSNDYVWARRGHLPASTFKITNSIIALETGVVKDDSTMFPWNGEKRRLSVWEKDMIFKEAFHASCVPCYQEVARIIGSDRMNTYLDSLTYGNMDVDSSNIDLFWLEGNSTITQFQQIDFLNRFFHHKLPISPRTETIMKRLMLIEENDSFRLSGKTGWSVRNGNNNGWFVGYLEKNDRIYFFATNVEPTQSFNMKMFSKIRKQITFDAFKQLKII